MVTQLDLFETKSEAEMLREEIKEVRNQCSNVRRGLFARHNELAKLYYAMKVELDELKSLHMNRYPEDNKDAPEIMILEKEA